MTLYSFALFPKRCYKCGRRFVMERCDYFYREVGIEHCDIKCWRCSKCMKKYAKMDVPMEKPERIADDLVREITFVGKLSAEGMPHP